MKGEQDKKPVWLPLQTIYNKELKVAEFLREQGIEYYIPMMYELKDTKGDEGKAEHVLVPAVHNLLFIHLPYEKDAFQALLQACPHPAYFIKKARDSQEYSIVSDKEMENFMRASDPEIQGTRFIDSDKLKGKKGERVRIIKKGPLFGITGRFVRYGGRHYIAIEMQHSATLLKVSYTWCETFPEEEQEDYQTLKNI